MLNYIRKISVGLLIIYLHLVAVDVMANERLITIGTAGTNGVYYPAGGAICRLLQRGRKDHGIRCTVESTGGSIYNLNAIKNGDLNFGVAQSDWVYHAHEGKGVFEDQGKNPKLRTVFSLHSEPFTLMVRGQSNIKSFNDLKNKRFNIGNEGSSNRATLEKLMVQMKQNKGFFGPTSELRVADQGNALCGNKVDGIVHTAGHPNGMVQQVTSDCNVRIISIDDKNINSMIENHPYYSRVVIPGGMYSGNPDDITTFGVKAVIVTSQDVSDDLVYNVVKSVFDNLDNFKTLHPVFSTLEPSKMITEGIVAPLHPGAIRYYKERGWM